MIASPPRPLRLSASSAYLLNEHHAMHLDRPALAHRVDPLVRLPLDVHPVERHAQQARDAGPHLVFALAQLRSFENHRHVEIDRHKPAFSDEALRLAQEVSRVARFVSRIIVRKDLPNIRERQCPKQRVGDGVEDDVAVGVADWSSVVLEADATDDERATLPDRGHGLEAMEVVAVPDAQDRREGLGGWFPGAWGVCRHG